MLVGSLFGLVVCLLVCFFSWLAGLLGLLVCPFVCLCYRAYVFNVHVSANIQVIKGLLKLFGKASKSDGKAVWNPFGVWDKLQAFFLPGHGATAGTTAQRQGYFGSSGTSKFAPGNSQRGFMQYQSQQNYDRTNRNE